MISIIIPCFNVESTLDRAVQSCLRQAHVREIILVDDGSTDRSLELMQSYAAQHKHVRVYCMQQNSGAAMARNWGALHSDAPYLAFLDADDEYAENAFVFSVQAFAEIAHMAAIKLPCRFVGWPEDVTQHPSYATSSSILMNTFAGNLVIRREVFMAMGLFPDNPIFCQFGGEDGAFMWVLAHHFTVGQVEGEDFAVSIYYHTHSHGYRFFKSQQSGLPLDANDPRMATFTETLANEERWRTRLQSLSVLLNSSQPKGFQPVRHRFKSTDEVKSS